MPTNKQNLMMADPLFASMGNIPAEDALSTSMYLTIDPINAYGVSPRATRGYLYLRQQSRNAYFYILNADRPYKDMTSVQKSALLDALCVNAIDMHVRGEVYNEVLQSVNERNNDPQFRAPSPKLLAFLGDGDQLLLEEFDNAENPESLMNSKKEKFRAYFENFLANDEDPLGKIQDSRLRVQLFEKMEEGLAAEQGVRENSESVNNVEVQEEPVNSESVNNVEVQGAPVNNVEEQPEPVNSASADNATITRQQLIEENRRLRQTINDMIRQENMRLIKQIQELEARIAAATSGLPFRVPDIPVTGTEALNREEKVNMENQMQDSEPQDLVDDAMFNNLVEDAEPEEPEEGYDGDEEEGDEVDEEGEKLEEGKKPEEGNEAEKEDEELKEGYDADEEDEDEYRNEDVQPEVNKTEVQPEVNKEKPQPQVNSEKENQFKEDKEPESQEKAEEPQSQEKAEESQSQEKAKEPQSQEKVKGSESQMNSEEVPIKENIEVPGSSVNIEENPIDNKAKEVRQASKEKEPRSIYGPNATTEEEIKVEEPRFEEDSFASHLLYAEFPINAEYMGHPADQVYGTIPDPFEHGITTFHGEAKKAEEFLAKVNKPYAEMTQNEKDEVVDALCTNAIDLNIRQERYKQYVGDEKGVTTANTPSASDENSFWHILQNGKLTNEMLTELKDMIRETYKEAMDKASNPDAMIKDWRVRLDTLVAIQNGVLEAEKEQAQPEMAASQENPAKNNEMQPESVKENKVSQEQAAESEAKQASSKENEINPEPANNNEVKQEFAQGNNDKQESVNDNNIKQELENDNNIKPEPENGNNVKQEPVNGSEIKQEQPKAVAPVNPAGLSADSYMKLSPAEVYGNSLEADNPFNELRDRFTQAQERLSALKSWDQLSEQEQETAKDDLTLMCLDRYIRNDRLHQANTADAGTPECSMEAMKNGFADRFIGEIRNDVDTEVIISNDVNKLMKDNIAMDENVYSNMIQQHSIGENVKSALDEDLHENNLADSFESIELVAPASPRERNYMGLSPDEVYGSLFGDESMTVLRDQSSAAQNYLDQLDVAPSQMNDEQKDTLAENLSTNAVDLMVRMERFSNQRHNRPLDDGPMQNLIRGKGDIYQKMWALRGNFRKQFRQMIDENPDMDFTSWKERFKNLTELQFKDKKSEMQNVKEASNVKQQEASQKAKAASKIENPVKSQPEKGRPESAKLRELESEISQIPEQDEPSVEMSDDEVEAFLRYGFEESDEISDLEEEEIEPADPMEMEPEDYMKLSVDEVYGTNQDASDGVKLFRDQIKAAYAYLNGFKGLGLTYGTLAPVERNGVLEAYKFVMLDQAFRENQLKVDKVLGEDMKYKLDNSNKVKQRIITTKDEFTDICLKDLENNLTASPDKLTNLSKRGKIWKQFKQQRQEAREAQRSNRRKTEKELDKTLKSKEKNKSTGKNKSTDKNKSTGKNKSISKNNGRNKESLL